LFSKATRTTGSIPFLTGVLRRAYTA